MNEGNTPIDILLVRGNTNDHYLTNEMLRLRRLSNELHAVDGDIEALDFLNGRNEFASAAQPGVVVIDLDDVDGDRLLVAIRNNPDFFETPVIILSDGNDHTIDLRLDYGPTTWLTRPTSFQQLTAAMKEFGTMSFEVNMLRHDRWYETQMWIRDLGETSDDIDLSEVLALTQHA